MSFLQLSIIYTQLMSFLQLSIIYTQLMSLLQRSIICILNSWASSVPFIVRPSRYSQRKQVLLRQNSLEAK